MNRTSAEATKMLITLERNLTIGLPPMVSNYCNLLQAVLLPKQIGNKCCIFSAIHSLAANVSGGLHHSTELIGNVFAARNNSWSWSHLRCGVRAFRSHFQLVIFRSDNQKLENPHGLCTAGCEPDITAGRASLNHFRKATSRGKDQSAKMRAIYPA
jgi:hypothetical protein